MIGPDIRNEKIIHSAEFQSNTLAQQFLLRMSGGRIDEHICIEP
jgi:hypothetical protein